MMKHLEDFEAGQVFTFRTAPLGEPDIIAFASQWDPQRLHTDKEYATSIHGNLIASGFQTLLLVFGPIMRDLMTGVANIGGTGFDRLRWHRPLYPGQPLDVRMEVLTVRPSRSKPDRGIISYRVEASNPSGDLVLSLDTAAMVKRRGQAG
jgi:acyl dehydratase